MYMQLMEERGNIIKVNQMWCVFKYYLTSLSKLYIIFELVYEIGFDYYIHKSGIIRYYFAFVTNRDHHLL